MSNIQNKEDSYISKEKLASRKKRIRAMLKTLSGLYPHTTMALKYSTDWELLVAVILSAQCTDARVNMVTRKLFQKYKTIDDYLNASPSEFEQDIHSTGFFRNKARNILAAARVVRDDFGGSIPATMDEILTIPGVARKTANVVLGIVHKVHEGIAVDTHVRRFAIRFDLSDFVDPVRIEKDLMLITPRDMWPRLTYLFIEYGRNICPARRHDCAAHPLTLIYPPAGNIWPRAK